MGEKQEHGCLQIEMTIEAERDGELSELEWRKNRRKTKHVEERGK